jgi:hypothetical protein
MMRLIPSRASREVGQLVKQHIQLHGASLDGNLADTPSPRRVRRSSEQSLRLPRVGIGDHNRGGDTFSGLENYTLSGDDLRYRNAGGNHRTRFTRGIAKIKGDHAHTAIDIAPHARHSAEPA